MRIAFVCGEYPPGPHGGIGTFVQLLARALAKAGHEVRVVGVCPRHYPGEDYELDHGIEVWRLRETRLPKLGWIYDRWRTYRCVAGWSRRGEIGLIEVADFGAGVAFWPRLPVPVVARLHGSETFFANELARGVSALDFQLERASLRRADFVCAVTRYTADRTQALFALDDRDIEVIHNFVELPILPEPRAKVETNVVFTGTLTAKKGVISLFKAWSRILDSIPNAILHLFGKDGNGPGGTSMRQYLLSLLQSGHQSSVRFHGHVSREQLFAAFGGARAAVFPSYAESFGLAPIESMACGCPTVYTSRPPGPEIIQQEVDGLLVDPDRPEQIAGAILRLCRDDILANRLGLAGRMKVQRQFSAEVAAPRNEAFYARCIERFRCNRSALQ